MAGQVERDYYSDQFNLSVSTEIRQSEAKLMYLAYTGVFLLALLAAAGGILLAFKITSAIPERRPPISELFVICVVSAPLGVVGMNVAHRFVDENSMGVLELNIGLGCAAAASLLMTLALMLSSR